MYDEEEYEEEFKEPVYLGYNDNESAKKFLYNYEYEDKSTNIANVKLIKNYEILIETIIAETIVNLLTYQDTHINENLSENKELVNTLKSTHIDKIIRFLCEQNYCEKIKTYIQNPNMASIYNQLRTHPSIGISKINDLYAKIVNHINNIIDGWNKYLLEVLNKNIPDDLKRLILSSLQEPGEPDEPPSKRNRHEFKSPRKSFRKVRKSRRKVRKSPRKVRKSFRKVRKSPRKVRKSARKVRKSPRKVRKSSIKRRKSK
jgi:hypothetical protein